jgi:hypothetical protein
MKVRSPKKSVEILIACLLAGIVAVSCGTGTSPQTEAPKTEIEEKQPEQGAELPPAQPAGSPDDFVMLEDLIYPGAEFLFEMPGFGGPMIPWRFYSVRNASTADVAAFYRDRVGWFHVESDDAVDGHQQLMLTYSAPMQQLDGVTEYDQLAEIGASIDGALVGVEVVNSNISAGFSRLLVARESTEETAAVPADTTILVLEYFANPF